MEDGSSDIPGVFANAMGINMTLGSAIRPWPFLLRYCFNACMVGLLDLGGDAVVTRLLKHGFERK